VAEVYYMQDKVGENHGSVWAVVPFGLFVALDDIFIEGCPHLDLGSDYFHFDESAHELAASHRARYRLSVGWGAGRARRPRDDEDRFPLIEGPQRRPNGSKTERDRAEAEVAVHAASRRGAAPRSWQEGAGPVFEPSVQFEVPETVVAVGEKVSGESARRRPGGSDRWRRARGDRRQYETAQAEARKISAAAAEASA